jgi:hypothetical protein
MAGCHHSRIPSPFPHPADYRCCAKRIPSALVAKAYLPHQEVWVGLVDTISPLVIRERDDYRWSEMIPFVIPPGFLTLRI